jgi:leader peptidase (prepilin peptidase)/N-methyltransferase
MTIIDYFASNQAVFIAACFVFGLLIGSFLNVVILRLPVMLERDWRKQCSELFGGEVEQHETFNLVTPRSRCPACGHQITALENIPVISYLLLKGRCKACGTSISPRYPITELLTAILTATVAWHFGFTWQAGAAILLTWALIALSVIDIDTQLLPDAITLPFLWLGLLLSLVPLFATPGIAIIGAVAGYLSLWLVYHTFRILTGKEGMGYGDFKLLAVFGAWFGWQALPTIVLLSSLVGAVIGISMIIVRGRDRNLPIPFGPYLAIAGWITMLWGEQLVSLYRDYAGL